MSRKELLQKESDRIRKASERRDVSFWRPSVGKNVARVLPHWSGDMGKVFFKKTKVHFGIGPEKNRVVCRLNLNSASEACPVCDYVKDLLQSGRREDAFIAKDIMSRERFAVNMIDVQDPKAGVQVWEMGRGLFNDVLLLFLDDEYGDLDNLESGRHVIINRQGEGKTDTRYHVMPSSTVTRVPQKVMERAHDLDNIYPIPSSEEVLAILHGEEYIEEQEGEDILAGAGETGKEAAVVEKEAGLEEGLDELDIETLEIPIDDLPEEKKEAEPAKKETPPKAAAAVGSERTQRLRALRNAASTAEREKK